MSLSTKMGPLDSPIRLAWQNLIYYHCGTNIMGLTKFLLLFLICFTLSNPGRSQSTFTKAQDVFDAREVICYGFDFTKLKIVDTKRMGQDLKSYFFKLTSFLQDNLDEKKFAKWMNKSSVKYNLTPTFELNKMIDNDLIVAASPSTISKDSLQGMVNMYRMPEQSGIGCVFIFECFNNSAKTVSAYEVFFDIATKKVLWSQYVSKRDGNSYNRMSDWSATSFMALKELTNGYLAAGGKR